MKIYTTVLRQKRNLRIVRCYHKRKGVWFEIQKKAFLFNKWRTYIGGNAIGCSYDATGKTFSEIADLARHWFDWEVES